MPVEWNKVTWYSKIIAVILFVVVFYVGFKLGTDKKEIESTGEIKQEKVVKNKTPITITTEDIKDKNFTGTSPKIVGTSVLAQSARDYVAEIISEFKKQADIDVPDMREKFGSDSPTANYDINIEAKLLTSPKTESIVIRVYTYTGGAHGNSAYKVFTAGADGEKILSLANVIQKDKQSSFTQLVKNKLHAWRPEGSSASPVFPDDVNALVFNSFTNWSLGGEDLIIYFSQYEIGPGVLGEVAFPIPLSSLKDYLNSDYSF